MNKLSPSLIAALLVHGAGFTLMLLRIEPFYTFFYSLAWWSFIIFVALLNQRLGSNSLLLRSAKSFVGITLLSIVFWLLFEAYNLRLGNWHYIGVPIERSLRWPGFLVAFATVLPGVLETDRLLWNLGIGRERNARRLRVTRALLVRILVTGALMMIAPLLRPDLFFPFIWVGLIFLFDPLLYFSSRRRRSLIGAAQEGHYGRAIRLLVAGFVCGLLWEFWNFWAGSKWLYTIPYFDYLRVFEMPILGYFGFPFFAVECYLVYQVGLLLRTKRVLQGRLAVTLWVFAGLLYAAVIVVLMESSTILTYKILF